MYSIYLVKATCKPVLVSSGLAYKEAEKSAEKLYTAWHTLFKAGLASSGVSVQVVESIHDAEVSSIEIGGIPAQLVLFACGGF